LVPWALVEPEELPHPNLRTRKEMFGDAKLTFLYSGTIGRAHVFNEFFLLARELKRRGRDVEVWFSGRDIESSGLGDWDGMPMSLLLRDVMERAATVEEGLDILRNTPRTCEYYYVLSDKSRSLAAVHADAREITVLRPGEQHPLLPRVPDDTVLISGEGRAEVLSQRLQENYGKIDAAAMMAIIKRPVAMQSNLHDAIMAPETLDMWVADAGRRTPACDEPYAQVNLGELIRFYRQTVSGSGD